ncbi:MAG: flagellar protein [Robiginitomaculum sp.]|nr:MAG: flagellar protein [Robiginitomaculum sp.]
MPFAPVIPISGLGGWKFLERTQERQQEVFNRSPDIQRNIEYFRENIENVTTIKELVGDRRLLTVALGAFGLSDEINKQGFVRKILEEGLFDERSFANRLSNSKYIAFAEAFPFKDSGFFPTSETIDDVVDKYLTISFEESVGEVDNTMRLALNFKREMKLLADQDLSRDTGWFRAMGSKPIRAVLEAAFNLPASFSQIDLDQQLVTMVDKAKQYFGGDSIKVFSDVDKIDEAIRRFQLREQIKNGPDLTTPGYAALVLLGGTGNSFGAAGIFNLLMSNN